jgi:hypothetical protein
MYIACMCSLSRYIEDLPTDGDAAAERMQYLRDHNWIDRRTRALFIDIPLYNANSGIMTMISLIVEWDAGGAATLSSHFRSAILFRYLACFPAPSLTSNVTVRLSLAFCLSHVVLCALGTKPPRTGSSWAPKLRPSCTWCFLSTRN